MDKCHLDKCCLDFFPLFVTFFNSEASLTAIPFLSMRSDASWLDPSCQHEGYIMWNPQNCMRAPSSGTLMVEWGLHMRETSWWQDMKLLMPTWGLKVKWRLYMVCPHDGKTSDFPCHHEGSGLHHVESKWWHNGKGFVIWTPHEISIFVQRSRRELDDIHIYAATGK